MNKAKRVANSALLGLLLSVFMLRQSYADSPYTYRIEEGDVLAIDIVLRGSLADLSKLSVGLSLEVVGESIYSHHSVTVTPDGYIFLPGLSPVAVRGATLGDVEQKISTMLNLPRNQHFVSVALVRTNSLAFHVWGEVKQPGRYLIDHPTTLVEALTDAGGPTEYARMRKVLLIREGQPSIEVDLSTKQLKTAGAPTIFIKPADTVVVPRSWRPEGITMLILLTAISTATGIYVATKQ